MISVEEAQERILAAVRPLAAETLPTAAALGRFASEPVRALVDLPVADNSAMDGYAVPAAALRQASPENPVRLRLIGEAPAGAPLGKRVGAGECARVFTGSVLPAGADAVVMQEDIQREGAEILFHEKIAPWENIRLRGEEMRQGDIIAAPGDRFNALILGLTAAAGNATVRAVRRPVVGILATGSELVEPGRPLEPGMIYESNRLLLASLVAQAGAEPKTYPLVPDALPATTAALQTAFAECDFVITSGGVSVGDLDLVKPAFAQLGGLLEFWTVSMRPGKPFAFGRWSDKLLFGLPGNPVSAAVTFLLLTRIALRRAQGAAQTNPRVFSGMLCEPLTNSSDRRHFVQVILAPDGRVSSAGPQTSHRVATLARSSGVVDIPPKTTLPAGTKADVLLWD